MNKVIITMDDGSTIIFRNENGLSENNMFNAIFNGLITYNNEQDKLIINSISNLSNDDKDIINALINYINTKNTK